MSIQWVNLSPLPSKEVTHTKFLHLKKNSFQTKGSSEDCTHIFQHLLSLHGLKGLQNTVTIVMMCPLHTHTFVLSLLLGIHPSDGCCPFGIAAWTMVGVGILRWQNTKYQQLQGVQHSSVRESAWRTWLQHCWLWCSWSPTSVREVRCFYCTGWLYIHKYSPLV